MDRTKAIPSMFHRRLLLLLILFAAITLVLSAQMFRLSVLQGSERRTAAESRLVRRTFLPTYRGRILDRHGRVLALDRASNEVAVDYDVITDTWPRNQAAAEARRELGRARWFSMSPEERDVAIRQRLGPWEEKCEDLWDTICRLGNLSREDLQQRLDAIKADVQSTAAIVWEQQRERERQRFGIEEDEEFNFKARPIIEQTSSHVILPRVEDEVAFAFRRIAEQLPGVVTVQDSRKREYPWLNAEVRLERDSLPQMIRSHEPMVIGVTGVADHILGSVRDDIWYEDVERRPFRDSSTENIDLGWYKPGDVVGSTGIERTFEDHLRGLRGVIESRRDTGEQSRVNAAPGQDVWLTIDIALQARVQAILSPEFGLTRVQPWHNNKALPMGTPLNSAAVVLEVETGEVLAMVSMPTLAMGQNMTETQRDRSQYQFNRPAEAVYPPGSIIKPLVLAAAVSEGAVSLDSGIECTGHFFSHNPSVARCWIYRERYGMTTHGTLHPREAIARSCNIFFYTLADRLGIEKLSNWLGRFGLGSSLDIGLGYTVTGPDGSLIVAGEGTGEIPTESTIASLRASGQLKFNQVILGIGQGPVSWTPVQAANAYATLARGGVIRDATILLEDIRGTRTPRTSNLPIDNSVVETALEGLRQSVMESFGTGHHITHEDGSREPIINARGVTVWAKTGTAQANAALGLDHSWFVGLVGPGEANRPLVAVAVIIENGGSGGRTAGPVANQIIHALQNEGYLPGLSNANREITAPEESESTDEDEAEP